jgi:putative phosphoesterase
MRIGVVGDTHNNLRSVQRIVAIFNAERVSRVIHTGDITQAKVLDAFAALHATLHGVYGNNDQERPALVAAAARHSMEIVDGPLNVEWHGRRILVVHDPNELDDHLRSHHALAIHGHTHLHRLEEISGTLVFNPGECAGMLPGLNAVGIVDLVALTCELRRF